jgi:hypothetical protein
MEEFNIKSLIILAWMVIASAFTCYANETAIPLLSIKDTTWTTEESAFVTALHLKSSLKTATKISSAV